MSIEWQLFLAAVFAVVGFGGWVWTENKLWHTEFDLSDADARIDWYARELREANQHIAELRHQIDSHDCGVATVTPLESAKRRHPSRLGPAS